MTAKQLTIKSFSWILSPNRGLLGSAFDEFITGRFRVRIGGDSLVVEVQALQSEDVAAEARKVAERYLELLRQYGGVLVRLMTVEEFALLPAQIVMMTGLNREEQERISRAMRKARGELVKDETLRRCYEYLQSAREEEKNVLPLLYKVVETIQHELGGEERTAEQLGFGGELKFVKRLANERMGDERHAPRPGEVVRKPAGSEIGRAMEYTRLIVQAYERYAIDRTT